MRKQTMIHNMTSTPDKRNGLENLSAEDKLQIILELSESENFTDLLDFIGQAYDDAHWCNSYR